MSNFPSFNLNHRVFAVTRSKTEKKQVELLMPRHTGLKGVIVADTHCH